LAHRAGALLLVDAAQTAGVLPIDVPQLGIDLLAFTGHKSLQGPTGTGGLVINETVDTALIEPLVYGGTGSRSAHEQQPEFCPDKFESGTPNGAGIAGLGAGVRWVLEQGIGALRDHDRQLASLLVEGLKLHCWRDRLRSHRSPAGGQQRFRSPSPDGTCPRSVCSLDEQFGHSLSSRLALCPGCSPDLG
jgi:selenocysteine lyase/cysteine desulfurase